MPLATHSTLKSTFPQPLIKKTFAPVDIPADRSLQYLSSQRWNDNHSSKDKRYSSDAAMLIEASRHTMWTENDAIFSRPQIGCWAVQQ